MAEVANPMHALQAERRRTRPPWTAPTTSRASHTLAVASDVLDVLETQGVSPTELRVLLALQADELELSELAREVDRHPTAIRPVAGRLYARGFLNWRYVSRENTRREPDDVLGITEAGRAKIRPLLERIG